MGNAEYPVNSGFSLRGVVKGRPVPGREHGCFFLFSEDDSTILPEAPVI
jgi:hypothetical protein